MNTSKKYLFQHFSFSFQNIITSFQSQITKVMLGYICAPKRFDMKKIMIALFFISLIFFQNAKAQTGEASPKAERVQFGFYDGTVIAGYVDHGGYLNFTGPNVSYVFGKSKILAGMLPSLRFKEDKSEVKNAFVTPTLGIGITYSYKKFAVQVPFYYNAKTSNVNGKWNIGIGIGLKFK